MEVQSFIDELRWSIDEGLQPMDESAAFIGGGGDAIDGFRTAVIEGAGNNHSSFSRLDSGATPRAIIRVPS